MSKKRVVVTGLGALSSIGVGKDKFAESIWIGKNGVSETTLFDTTNFPQTKGCQIHDFEPKRWISKLDPKKMGRSSQLSVGASKLALEDAGVDVLTLRKKTGGVVFGTTDGEGTVNEILVKQFFESENAVEIDSILISSASPNRISQSVIEEFGLRADALTITSACAAGNYATGYAYDRISLGDIDYAICGGADGMSRKTMLGFYRLGTLAKDFCRPFDKNRDGILTAEGAGCLFLETLESAQKRNAKIYAELLGYGLNCDAKHPIHPDRDSIAECIRLAHKNAGVAKEDIDFISVHGTGTLANDYTEAGAIRDVFGEKPPPVSALKSMIGHTMGAASAFSAIASIIAIEKGFIPPTINHCETDTECNLDCVPNKARSADIKLVQNNGFAFGGNNAILIISKFIN